MTDEDGVEAGVGPAGMPVEEDAVLGVMVGPEVALLGFATSRFEVADRSFVDFEVVTEAEFFGLVVVEAAQESGEVVVPGAHEVTSEDDAMGGFEAPFLSIEGLVVAELFGEKKGSK